MYKLLGYWRDVPVRGADYEPISNWRSQIILYIYMYIYHVY